jgi:molybdopterin synthase catalytic subunit
VIELINIASLNKAKPMVSVQYEDFTHAKEYESLRSLTNNDGAIVTFTGLVRDFNDSDEVIGIELEHYPSMTHNALEDICAKARARWPLGHIRLIHRIGKIMANEQIVFVGVSSKHRKAAFEACEFIMDYLKADVPLWKKELSPHQSVWVKAKPSDKQALKKWL